MLNLNLGSTYRKGKIDVSKEVVPANPAFWAKENEQHIFEEREDGASNYQLTLALEKGQITALDQTVVSIVAVFASTACTSKMISECLTMMGVKYTKNILESSLKRLHRYQLINFSRFKQEEFSVPSNLRIITLTDFGSRLAGALGVRHKFNSFAVATADCYSIKSRCETTQLICNWLKNLSDDIQQFQVRPIISVNREIGAVVRPSARIDICDETIYFEVPRNHEDYLEELIEKLHRYELVFGKDNPPAIIINGENEEMNREIFHALQKEKISAEIMYTDDLANFGGGFRTSIYSFNEEGKKQIFYLKTG